MPVDIIDCVQGEPAWFSARCGLPTASVFASLMAKGDGKMRKGLLYKLAGEVVTGEPAESYSNGFMERGKILEAEARALYAMLQDDEVRQVGFLRNGSKGASPDALCGSAGGLEIKTRTAALMIETLERDTPPPEHMAQVQGNMWVAEREWWDLLVYSSRRMPHRVFRIRRDAEYIARVAEAVDAFNDDLMALVERVRRYGGPEAEAA